MFKRLIKSEAFRQRTVWVVAAVLILPFILFFSSSAPVNGPGEDEAGRLFGRPVPWDTFQQQRVWVRRQLPEELDLPEAVLTQATWERLMLLAEARRRKVRVEDRQVAKLIQDTPAFQVEGRFDPLRYHQFLKAMGTSPQVFEGFVRDDLLLQQLLDEAKASVQVTDELLRDAYRTRHEKARVALLSWDATERVPAIAQGLGEETLKAYYDAHHQEFQEPAQITLEYLGRTREESAGSLSLTEEELKAYFEAHQDELAKEGEAPPAFESAKEDVRTRLLAERIRRQLSALATELDVALDEGKTLEDLGAAHTLSLQRFGPTPVGQLWVAGAPDLSVLQAAFALQAGGVSDVIETDHGVYVVRVVQLTPARVKSLEEVRDAVRQRAAAEQARAQTLETARGIREKLQAALDAGTPFDEAATPQGLTPAAPGLFGRSDPIEGIGIVPELSAAVFATEAGRLTDVVALPERVALAYVHERQQPSEDGFEAEREALAAQVREDQERSRVGAWFEEVRARARLQSFVKPEASGS